MEKMNREKVKFLMAGKCELCGKRFKRVPPQDAARCTGKNPAHEPSLVALAPFLILPAEIAKKFGLIAELADVPVEKLVNEFLMEGARQKLKELKTLPEIVVAAEGNIERVERSERSI